VFGDVPFLSGLAAEDLRQVGGTADRRLRAAGPRVEGGLAPGGQCGTLSVAGRLPVAAAALPGRRGQCGPVFVSRRRGQSRRGTFGAEGRVGPAQGAPGEVLSAPVLFGNNSYALGPAAISSLKRLLPRLREPGVTVVINGYASTPGAAAANYILSYQRATAVARWLEANGVPESALIIVGHGASDVTGSGASGANRRVLVVIEEPTAGA